MPSPDCKELAQDLAALLGVELLALLLQEPIEIWVVYVTVVALYCSAHQLVGSAFYLFFVSDTATTEIYTLSLHDALPISGYGGAITAARITAAPPKPSVCILERGREWEVGKFPDEIGEVVRNARNPTFNPTGLYDFLLFPDISVVKGCGLGGTSLVNANVAIVPDEEVFQQIAWPKAVKRPELIPFYEKARFMLGANPQPRGVPTQPDSLLKVRALHKRAQEIGGGAFPLDIVVSFKDGLNNAGV